MERAAVEVVDAGARTTFQDLGRAGYAALGVSPSGAADRPSFGLVNRLVGNDGDAVALEVVLGGLVLRALRSVRIALTGAPRPVLVDDHAVAMHTPIVVRRGEVLRVGHGQRGVYTYVAVHGGFVAEQTLGSASTDVLGGIGPAPLAAGDRLMIGPRTDLAQPVDVAPVPAPLDPVELRVVPGPRREWFTEDAFDVLCASTYTVMSASNRIALRLSGPPIARRFERELASEGLIVGAVQIPPDGMPVVFGADHPTTGGYPVLAVVIGRDVGFAAQARPGAAVRFRRARSR